MKPFRKPKNLYDFQIPEGLTFDDVTIIPVRSQVDSRSLVDLSTRVSRNITLQIPILSSYMDTVTEEDMAIEMARLGGIGILHRFCSIDQEVEMIRSVKRKEELIIRNPYAVRPDATLKEFRAFRRGAAKRVNSILVTDENDKLLGVMKYRYQLFKQDPTLQVKDRMAPAEKLLTMHEDEFKGLNQEEIFGKADRILDEDKIHKLIILVDNYQRVKGLITFRNLKNWESPQTTRDPQGRLAVAAGVGISGKYLDRTEAIVEAGADLIVVNVAHGHLEICLKAVKKLRKNFPDTDILAGSIATEKGADDLFKQADAVMVGIGNGSICRTRDVTGVGVPQVTALRWAFQAAQKRNKPIINDGGISTSGDLAKALVAGASAVIIGNRLAGTDESPSEREKIGGVEVKKHRGMASLDAKKKLLESEGYLDEEVEAELEALYASEGVEKGYVRYEGSARDVVNELINPLRSTLSHCDALTIEKLHKNVQKGKVGFVKNTEAGRKEGSPHHLEFQQW